MAKSKKKPRLSDSARAYSQQIESVKSAAGNADPLERAFIDILLSEVEKEDLEEIPPPMIARAARLAFDALKRRRVEEPEIETAPLSHDGVRLSALVLLNANRPFLLDSTLNALRAAGIHVHFVAHPILSVERDGKNRLTAVDDAHHDARRTGECDSVIVLLTDPIEDADAMVAQLHDVMCAVRTVVEDWKPMRARLTSAIDDYRRNAPKAERKVDEEAIAFLEWLLDDNFTFLGTRSYDYYERDDRLVPKPVADGLGILRDDKVRVLRRRGKPAHMNPEVRAFLMSDDPLIVTKANERSQVHRKDYMDYIGLKRFDESGQIRGELRLIGLFTSSAYTRSVSDIPLIRDKVDRILSQADFEPTSHSGKALLAVLESFPRTELFQADVGLLAEQSRAVLRLSERPRVRALIRRDRFERFVSAIVYVPRERYSSSVRERIGELLARLFRGHVSGFEPDFPDDQLARVQFIIGLEGEEHPDPAVSVIESAIEALIQTWGDSFQEELSLAMPGRADPGFAKAFSAPYQAAYEPEQAVDDLTIALSLTDRRRFAARFDPPSDGETSHVNLRIWHKGSSLPLSERVPTIEHLGFAAINERTFRIDLPDAETVFLHDMLLRSGTGSAIAIDDYAEPLRAALMAVRLTKVDDDAFNALVLAGLGWRECALLRTAARYLQQAGTTYSRNYIAVVLRRHAEIARLLVELFDTRLKPGLDDRKQAEMDIRQAIDEELQSVESLDDDRILGLIRTVIMATLRTDFFAIGSDGHPPAAITLKLDPKQISILPAPRPYREIFVHSPQVEGLHLRFGPVARGGLRWSDRPQDFRQEVLGLVKAQQVKNAVIVPVGAKGGFVPRRLPVNGSRDEIYEAGRQAYITFVDRLLAVTDNIEDDDIVPPAGVVRRDGDDPYLVVAADKGTARFSDTANEIAERRGFWLDDAFASGGSAGYDHKAMGITARGAWEAVKRHFLEMDVNPEADPIRVAGVGDMSGDVFGNGMILSRSMKLVAAFDHRHIFIDPDPDPEKSWAERKRLFDLPSSSWADYDSTLLSKGGGIFSRGDKAVALSKEARDLLGFEEGQPAPTDVMRAILKAPVDLFWFGGIGTYVRGPGETNAEVGDRANDAIRIEADDFGAKVAGEGANLGMTQRARIAYSLKGGRCNSDAIDNSGGVNSSDVEVNIKIALRPLETRGELERKARNKLLVAMTPAVADLVLRNNALQTLAISLTERRGMADFPYQVRLIEMLEDRGLLDRVVETLQDDAALQERQTAGIPLTRPELGVLLAYAKIALFTDLLDSDVPDDPYLARELMRYFPPRMQKAYPQAIEAHRLRAEIIATQLSNALVNRAGPTVIARMRDTSAATSADLTRAYAATRDTFGFTDLNAAIDALAFKIPGALQLDLYGLVQNVLLEGMEWMLRHADFGRGIGAVVERYRDACGELGKLLDEHMPEDSREEITRRSQGWIEAGVPQETALGIARLPLLVHAPDIDHIARRSERPIEEAIRVYFEAADHFGITRIDREMRRYKTEDYYDRLALERAHRTLAEAHVSLSRAALKQGGLDALDSRHPKTYSAIEDRISSLLADGTPSLSKLTVAAGLLADMAG